MKKIIFTTLLFPLFICGMCHKDGRWNIPIINNSSIDIYYSAVEVGGKHFQHNISPKPYQPHRVHDKVHIKPGKTTTPPYDINLGDTFEDIFSYADSIRVYFFDANAYDKIADEIEIGFDFSDSRIYLGYKSYTWDDLERLNWKVIYPF